MTAMKFHAPSKMTCFNKISLLLLSIVMLTVVYSTTNYQHQHTKLETDYHPFDSTEEQKAATEQNHQPISIKVGHLPKGIIEQKSDMELKPMWSTKSHKYKETIQSQQNLLAIPVGLKQKKLVDNTVKKKFAVILFHYDGDVNSWNDLKWSNSVIHIAAVNQTKWWFAKRFLHPDVVSMYDYIFLWDEDIGAEYFNPRRYLEIMKSEGLEISQPALDSKSYEIHHRITMRQKKRKVHRRVTGTKVGDECSRSNREPPCTGWVEGMAPVFSRSSWRCAWHLIQNDLIHGWGMDMKLGYCVQGDRTKKVGVIDSEFILHQGVQTLGGSSLDKGHQKGTIDVRAEIRRQSRLELQTFEERWDRAVREDENWIDPFIPRHG